MSREDASRLIDYLEHIVQAIDRIEEYIEDHDEVAFIQDCRTQDAVIRNLEIIGEASNNIAKRFSDFAAENSEVPWLIAYEMRNILSHGYFQVDMSVVWRTIEIDLPQLDRQIKSILKLMLKEKQ